MLVSCDLAEMLLLEALHEAALLTLKAIQAVQQVDTAAHDIFLRGLHSVRAAKRELQVFEDLELFVGEQKRGLAIGLLAHVEYGRDLLSSWPGSLFPRFPPGRLASFLGCRLPGFLG